MFSKLLFKAFLLSKLIINLKRKNIKGEPLKCRYNISTIKGIEPFNTKKGDAPKCLYCICHYYTMNNDFGLIRLEDVIALTTLSKSTIYRRLATNNFPPKLNCGSNIAAWRVSDIKKYIERGLSWV